MKLRSDEQLSSQLGRGAGSAGSLPGPGAVGVSAGEERVSRGRADRLLHVGLLEEHALRGERVDVPARSQVHAMPELSKHGWGVGWGEAGGAGGTHGVCIHSTP